MVSGNLFVLSAPSGAGKTTVLGAVLKNIVNVSFSISHTTRLPRKGETNGVEYHFVTREEFTEMIQSGDFLEYAEVHGNLYGTSREAVQQQIASGIDVILDIDVQGARIVRLSPELQGIYIFLSPPSVRELEKRLKGRGLDSNENIAVRLANAQSEMAAMGEYEYCIVNDNIDDAIRMFEAIILAERARTKRDISGNTLEVGNS